MEKDTERHASSGSSRSHSHMSVTVALPLLRTKLLNQAKPTRQRVAPPRVLHTSNMMHLKVAETGQRVQAVVYDCLSTTRARTLARIKSVQLVRQRYLCSLVQLRDQTRTLAEHSQDCPPFAASLSAVYAVCSAEKLSKPKAGLA